jgi:hypothetical protein
MNPNLNPSDLAALLGVIDPQSSSTVKTTGWIAANTHTSFLCTLLFGAIASTGTATAKLEQATDSSGTGAKDITGKAITALTDVDDNKQMLINLRGNELDINNGFTHFRLSVTPATAASLLCATVQGFGAYNAPHANAATVDEVVG